jgi:hypothetical protein
LPTAVVDTAGVRFIGVTPVYDPSDAKVVNMTATVPAVPATAVRRKPQALYEPLDGVVYR